MAFSTTPILDSGVGGDAANLGASWSTDILAAGYTSFSRTSNQIDSTGFNSNWWNSRTYGPNSEIYATVDVMPTTNAGRLYINLQGVGTTAASGYEVEFWNDGSLFILRLSSGVRTQLASLGTGIVAGNKLGFENINDTLQVYRDTGSGWATFGASVAGGGNFGAGYVGIWAQNDAGIRLTNVGGGHVGGVGPILSNYSQFPKYKLRRQC